MTSFGAIFFSLSMFKMEVKVRKGERILRIKLNESIIHVLARLFNLLPESVYLVGNEMVVVADNLILDVLEISPSVVYDVFGEDVTRQSTGLNAPGNPLPPLGNVYGYQSASPSSGNSQGRPVAVELRNPLRPTFTKPGKRKCINSGAGIGAGVSRHDSVWRKGIFFYEVVEGKVSPIYQVYLNLTTDSANVEHVSRLLEEEVGTKVVLLDSHFLRVMQSDSTTGV